MSLGITLVVWIRDSRSNSYQEKAKSGRHPVKIIEEKRLPRLRLNRWRARKPTGSVRARVCRTDPCRHRRTRCSTRRLRRRTASGGPNRRLEKRKEDCASSSLQPWSYKEKVLTSNYHWRGGGHICDAWLDYRSLGRSWHHFNRDMNKTATHFCVTPKFETPLRWNNYHWPVANPGTSEALRTATVLLCMRINLKIWVTNYVHPYKIIYENQFEFRIVAFFTWNSSLVPLIQSLCTLNPYRFEFSVFGGIEPAT